jgi:hypothetical protein
VEKGLVGETEVLGENLPQCHFVRHKSHLTWPEFVPRAAAVEGRRLTAWAMALPSSQQKSPCVTNWLHCFVPRAEPQPYWTSRKQHTTGDTKTCRAFCNTEVYNRNLHSWLER